MSEKQHVDLALDGTQMFQRFIAKKTVEQRELKFEALDRAYVGFVTGLDDKWVRITAVSYTHLTLPTNREV